AATALGALLVNRFVPGWIPSFGAAEDPLLGQWGCHWSVNRGERQGSTIPDTITFDHVNQAMVEGHGEETEAGRYDFSGKNSAFAVSLAYAPHGANRNFVGVALLRKEPFADSLSGEWVQYLDDLEFAGGDVICKKQLSNH